jgi:hypothetical protein
MLFFAEDLVWIKVKVSVTIKESLNFHADENFTLRCEHSLGKLDRREYIMQLAKLKCFQLTSSGQ